MLIAVFSDFYSANQFHHEVRPPALGRARIEYVSDVRMVHQRKRLSLRLKACDHAFRVHSRFDDLEGDSAADRFLLFRHEDHSTTAFANLLQELVVSDAIAGLFPGSGFGPLFAYRRCRRLFQESSDAIIRLEQSLYLATEILVVSADAVQKSDALRGRELNRFRKEFNVASRVHASWMNRDTFTQSGPHA